jgi:hypothetical protein
MHLIGANRKFKRMGLRNKISGSLRLGTSGGQDEKKEESKKVHTGDTGDT